MTDYEALYRRLWQAVIFAEGRIGQDAAAFLARFVEALRAEGWQIGPESERRLAAYFGAVEAALREGIGSAIDVALAGAAAAREALPRPDATPLPRIPQSEMAARLAEEAFSRRWPDGLTLSDRVWAWKAGMRAGVERELAAGIRAGQSIDALTLAMQRAIEAAPSAAGAFEIAAIDYEDWASDLAAAGRALIHDPKARGRWEATLREARKHLAQLKESGTRRGAVTALKSIIKAVDTGREDLLDSALKWWGYDKQLYRLKRIARTEMATAAHRAIIADAAADDAIIGFQWRLSASHPAPDICDYYAGIEMGVGRGVWSKEAVPQHKAHPHCMCLLIPRVTPIKDAGTTDYAAFLRQVPPEKRAELLPQWANRLHGLGMAPDKLVRPDGLGLLSRAQMAARMGAERLHAAEALGQALTERDWGADLNIALGGRMARQMLAALPSSEGNREVAGFISRLERDGGHIDSRLWHYMKRKYVDGLALSSPAELDGKIERVLRDPESRVVRPGKRFKIYSPTEGWMVLVDESGRRVSAYPPDDVSEFDNPIWLLWLLKELTQ